MSQAPTEAGEAVSEEYKSAWDATRIATIQQGLSWSGNERNHVFLNTGAGHFADVSMISGSNSIGDGRAVATLDWDDDGLLDLVLKNRTGPRLQLFHNRYEGGGNYLVLTLEGNGTTTNRDAIGAHVEARLPDGRTLHTTLYSSDGFLSQSSKRLHLGLGAAERIEELSVIWPDGSRDVHTELGANQRLRIVQGQDVASLPAQRIEGMDTVRPRKLKIERTVSRAVLTSELPMGAVPLPSYELPERTVADLAGSPVLINLWQISCTNCRKEFVEFRRHYDEVQAAGLRIVAMNVDPAEEHDETRAIAQEHNLMPLAGVWNAELEKAIEVIYAEVFSDRTTVQMPLPTSLLLDSKGNLGVIYIGPVDMDQLLADLAVLEDERNLLPLDVLSHGRRLIYHKRNFREIAQRLEQVGLTELADYYRKVDKETKSFFFENGEKVPLSGNRLRGNLPDTRQAEVPPPDQANQPDVASPKSVAESNR